MQIIWHLRKFIHNPTYSDFIDLGYFIFRFPNLLRFLRYSSIAIGTAKLFGFELMQNFKRPYLAKSLPEFWSRWHISLSTWFKDYVYIPLGGNRKSNFKRNRNLLITFVTSGFWHGANWTFIIWGLVHGVMNASFRNYEKNFLMINRFITLTIVFLRGYFLGQIILMMFTQFSKI